MKNIYQTLNESLINKYFLFESKQDEQNLIDFAGEEVAKKFLDLRKKLKSPENDLYYWIKNKTPEELASFIDNYQSNRDVKSINKTEGAKLVFNKNGDKIYFVTTYDAMKYYGKGTKWCIAGNYAGHESRGQEYFNDYLEDLGSSGYYVVITPDTKICVLVKNDNVSDVSSIWNAEDDEISLFNFSVYVNQETMDFFGFSNECISWNGKTSLRGNNKVTEVIIEHGVTKIIDKAFVSCQRLKSVVIPNSVRSIGHMAFSRCSSLQSIEIPDSVTSIGTYAFEDCSSLSNIVIPNSVTVIHGNTFENCTALKSIVIPNSVTGIGNFAFEACLSLQSIEIPDSVTMIGYFAFDECKSLEHIKIPDLVTTIEDNTFSRCGSLTSIKIPRSVTSIGNYAFYACESLVDVYYSGAKEQFNKIDVGRNNEEFLNANIHFNS